MPAQALIYTRGHVITSGNLAMSVCLERCISMCFCCGLALDIVSSLTMVAVCDDKVNVVGHAAA